MGPYYDHASLQMRVFARASGRRRSAARAVRPRGGAAAGPVDRGKQRTRLIVGVLATPGVALALSVAGLLGKLGASDVWTMLSWRAVISAAIILLAAAASSLRLLAG
jgi:hypothetical protein